MPWSIAMAFNTMRNDYVQPHTQKTKKPEFGVACIFARKNSVTLETRRQSMDAIQSKCTQIRMLLLCILSSYGENIFQWNHVQTMVMLLLLFLVSSSHFGFSALMVATTTWCRFVFGGWQTLAQLIKQMTSNSIYVTQNHINVPIFRSHAVNSIGYTVF